MVAHNNLVPDEHFRKHDWPLHVKTWFHQPAQKKRRRLLRAKKAALSFPRPIEGMLRPVVRCSSVRYNKKERLGRGFTIEELKEAGMSILEARSLGIAVDKRRKNRSEEAFRQNVQRLKTYRSKLVIYPRRKAPKKVAPAAALPKIADAHQHTGPILPVYKPSPRFEARAITAEETERSVYQTLRRARKEAARAGKKDKKPKEETPAVKTEVAE